MTLETGRRVLAKQEMSADLLSQENYLNLKVTARAGCRQRIQFSVM